MPCKRLLREQERPPKPPRPESEVSDGLVREGPMAVLLEEYGPKNKVHTAYMQAVEQKPPKNTITAREYAKHLGITFSTFANWFHAKQWKKLKLKPSDFGRLHNIRWFRVSPTVFNRIKHG